jgi:hypothetical protein
MAAAHRRYGRRGHVTLDWALVAVALMALAVLIGTAIRTGTPGAPSQFGAQVGGLRALSETETLVVFEDGVTTASGWTGGRFENTSAGLGRILLAAPADVALSRSIPLPEGTVRAVLSLDLIAIDDWALQGLALSIDGTEVLRQRFTSRPGVDMPPTEGLRSDRIALRTEIREARELGFASGAPELAEQVVHVDLAIFTTGGMLDLTITPLPAEADGSLPMPLWAIDNLIITAERLP